MPLNLLKKYNELLELNGLNEYQRIKSLHKVFSRDFESDPIIFNDKNITPTQIDGKITMDTLFSHLTTKIEDKELRNRVFDKDRAERLHWVRYHLGKKKQDVLVFSTREPQGNRTYIYDKDEKYVIILEPLRKEKSYYLLTAYKLTGKDDKRDKILRKYKRKLAEVL